MIWNTSPPHSQFCQYLCFQLCQCWLCGFDFCSYVWRVLKQAHLPFLWQSGAACGCADLFVTLVCVCVCACAVPPRVCVCVCVCAVCALCVCSVCACVVAVWCCMRPCGLICHPCACDVPPRVCVWCVVCGVCMCVCVCVRALPFCCGSLVLHAALRTYLSLMCVCVCACAVPPRACVCGGGGGAVCVCARVGPLLWQSGTACGCADLFATRSCV